MAAYDPGQWYSPMEYDVLMMTGTLTVRNATTGEPYQVYRQEFIMRPGLHSAEALALLKANAEKAARFAIVLALIIVAQTGIVLVPLEEGTA